MKIEVSELKNYGDREHIKISIINGLSTFSGWDIININEIKELEKNLLEIVEELKKYRGTKC